jgi:hypothetical protein
MVCALFRPKNRRIYGEDAGSLPAERDKTLPPEVAKSGEIPAEGSNERSFRAQILYFLLEDPAKAVATPSEISIPPET